MSYPSTLDAFTPKIDLVDDVMAADINELQDAIEAMQTCFGTQFHLGWIPLPTCTYVSATSFTLSGDHTALLKVGIKWKGYNASQKYGYIQSSTYSSGTGLTTVNLVANTSYSLASGAISNAFISYATPPDFPAKLSYAPTVDAGSMGITITSGEANFAINGGWLYIDIAYLLTTSGTATNQIQITYPLAVYNLGYGTFASLQNKTASVAPGIVYRSTSTLFGIRPLDNTNFAIGANVRVSANGMVPLA